MRTKGDLYYIELVAAVQNLAARYVSRTDCVFVCVCVCVSPAKN
jgi:hypothetical protein